MNLKDAGIYDLTNIFKGEATIAHASSQGGVINNTPMHLLNALKYHAVIPALTNVIISAYAKDHSLTDSKAKKRIWL